MTSPQPKNHTPTTWTYDLDMEAARLIEMANRIIVGFYQAKGFYLLPWEKNQKIVHRASVTFPELDYSRIPRFWQKAKNIDYDHFPTSTGEDFIAEVKELILTSNNFDPAEPNQTTLKANWDVFNPYVLNFMNEIFPKSKKVKSIQIYISNIGTMCTFRMVNKKPPHDIKMYLRSDATAYHLVAGLFSALTRSDVFTQLKGGWEEGQLLVDWLISNTTLGEKMKSQGIELQPSLRSLQSLQDANLAKKSAQYFERLGLGIQTFDLKLKQLKGLSTREQKVLDLLMQHKGKVVTTDTIATLLFENEADFSFYVISKTIERLRTKLEKSGISSTFIQTKRGEGYILV